MTAASRAWPLNRFDALLVAQTDERRPMTTHHTLEVDRALSLDRWARALAQLVETYPELGARITAGARPRRLVSPPDRVTLSRRLVHDRDGSQGAIERWIGESIELERGLPVRVRIAPGQVAEQSVTLSLHHSVADSVGALALFDRLTAIAAGVPLPARGSKPFAEYEHSLRPELSELGVRLRQLRRPAARIVDVVDTATRGHRLALRDIDPTTWTQLGQMTSAAGVSQTTVLWHCLAAVAGAWRLDDNTLPIRIVADVNLRPCLGVPADALGNWCGTLEHEGLAPLTQLHAELASARRPDIALVTPSVLGTLTRSLPRALARAFFRQVDSDAWPNPCTLQFAHIRPPTRRCWPAGLRPRRLWCTSTVPRKPSLGITVTTVGDRVSIAASCQASILRRSTIEAFLDAVLERLQAHVAGTEQLRSAASR